MAFGPVGSDKRDERWAAGECARDRTGTARAAGPGRSSSPRGQQESGSSSGDCGWLPADHQQIQGAHHSPSGKTLRKSHNISKGSRKHFCSWPFYFLKNRKWIESWPISRVPRPSSSSSLLPSSSTSKSNLQRPKLTPRYCSLRGSSSDFIRYTCRKMLYICVCAFIRRPLRWSCVRWRCSRRTDKCPCLRHSCPTLSWGTVEIMTASWCCSSSPDSSVRYYSSVIVYG